MSIALIDYNMGNLGSVAKALEFLGAKCEVVEKASELERFGSCLLPGVGSFGDGMEALCSRGFDAALPRFIASGKFFLGICLGMQMLLEYSEESPGVRGLSIFPGTVRKFRSAELKVPHMGWNAAEFSPASPLANSLNSGAFFYFVHSYYAEPADPAEVLLRSEYMLPFAAAVGRRNLFATQFHPEKSQQAGLELLRAFIGFCG